MLLFAFALVCQWYVKLAMVLDFQDGSRENGLNTLSFSLSLYTH